MTSDGRSSFGSSLFAGQDHQRSKQLSRFMPQGTGKSWSLVDKNQSLNRDVGR
jgi:hypothetical protein